MRYSVLISTSALIMMITAAGCGPAVRSQAALEPMVAGDKAAAMDAAERALREMYFTIDKFDADAGYIRTHPLRAGQFFELWRRDNASPQAFAHANLDSLRRTVEIVLEPDNDVIALRCVVTVEKLTLPPQPVRSMSQLAGMYTDSSRRVQTLALDRDIIARAQWIDLGPDEALQHYILTQIQRRL